jgi:Asp/Glu/hydantoin racemase
MLYRVTRKSQSWYGETIGILILKASYPCIPGNVGNATTFSFPVRYEEVRGATIDRLLNQKDPDLAQPFLHAAQRLRDQGVRAITGACGFMALFQKQIGAALDIPVFLSSLMQIPFIYQITGKPIGIITADATCLNSSHFENCDIPSGLPVFVAGMQTQQEFREAILEEKGTLDSARIEKEVVNVARELVAENPEVGAILLECSDLPPYAHAIQAATGLPVFDFTTMIESVHHALVRVPYSGIM